MKNSLFTALRIAFELHQSDLETIICYTIFKMNIAILLRDFTSFKYLVQWIAAKQHLC